MNLFNKNRRLAKRLGVSEEYLRLEFPRHLRATIPSPEVKRLMESTAYITPEHVQELEDWPTTEGFDMSSMEL